MNRNLQPLKSMVRKMTSKYTKQEVANAFIDSMGGATEVARMLTSNLGRKINRVTVQKWKNNGVPHKMVSVLSKLTLVENRFIRPDL